MRSTQYYPVFQTGVRFTNIQVPDGDFEPEYQETFTRRQKRLYEQATGQQRTETKRIVTKRKASTLGKAQQASCKANRSTRT